MTEYHPIYTAGYTGSTPDDLAAFADHLGALVVDVRRFARSRVARWNGAPLGASLGAERYRWVPAFGNVNYARPGAPIMLHDPEAGLRIVLPLLAAQPVILLCACAYKERATCHRLVVADLLAQETGASVEHLPTRFEQWQRPRLMEAPNA